MRLHRRDSSERPELPGVPDGWSTTYVQPDYEPPEGQPAARRPGARVRIVPTETLRGGPLEQHLGEVVQLAIREGADLGVSVEVDTADRTRHGEQRGGASPIEAIDILIYTAAGGAGAYLARQIERLGDRLFDAALEWALRHRRRAGPWDDPISVTLWGPDGKPSRTYSSHKGRATPRRTTLTSTRRSSRECALRDSSDDA